MTKKKKKSRHAKAASEGLEGFVDRTNLAVSQSTEEKEVEMSNLVAGFAMRMHKRPTKAQEGTTPCLEVPGGKRSRPSRFDEEVQVDMAMITVDSLEQVLEAPSAVGGAT